VVANGVEMAVPEAAQLVQATVTATSAAAARWRRATW
jgi:hypothetical protein